MRLKATGQVGLKKNMAKSIRVATEPCREWVRLELLRDMPKRGGLNEWLAKSSITSAILTGPNTAGVVVRGSRRGHDWRAINDTGKARHPTFGHRGKNQWKDTSVPAHVWEHALAPFGPIVREALRVSMNVTAREAGFNGI